MNKHKCFIKGDYIPEDILNFVSFVYVGVGYLEVELGNSNFVYADENGLLFRDLQPLLMCVRFGMGL